MAVVQGLGVARNNNLAGTVVVSYLYNTASFDWCCGTHSAIRRYIQSQHCRHTAGCSCPARFISPRDVELMSDPRRSDGSRPRPAPRTLLSCVRQEMSKARVTPILHYGPCGQARREQGRLLDGRISQRHVGTFEA